MAFPIITVLTDFGLQDTYVGQMHGMIAGIAPHARVIDLTHGVLPQNRLQAAVLLADAAPVFPAGTIHVFVVDPGVGTDRGLLAAEIGSWRFVGPDNGVLTAVLDQWPVQQAVRLTNVDYWGGRLSRTFHGRDVLAPVAAHWAAGIPLTEFGPACATPLVRLSLPQPQVLPRSIVGEVLYVDGFGNLITNILADQLPTERETLTVTLGRSVAEPTGPSALGGHRLELRSCYAEKPGEPLALVGSSGRVEIAVGNGSAAERLQQGAGTPVCVEW